jgi:hypothetical protein
LFAQQVSHKIVPAVFGEILAVPTLVTVVLAGKNEQIELFAGFYQRFG